MVIRSAMKAARCKKDVILSSSEEILLLVRHSGNAHQMIEKVKQMFVGIITSQRRNLQVRYMKIQFRGSYFQFMTDSQGITAELAGVDGIQSLTSFTLRWLKEFPNALAEQTYPETVALEALIQDGEDGSMSTYQNIFGKLLEYLMAIGSYDVTRI